MCFFLPDATFEIDCDGLNNKTTASFGAVTYDEIYIVMQPT